MNDREVNKMLWEVLNRPLEQPTEINPWPLVIIAVVVLWVGAWYAAWLARLI